jgi:hypothetical protein
MGDRIRRRRHDWTMFQDLHRTKDHNHSHLQHSDGSLPTSQTCQETSV